MGTAGFGFSFFPLPNEGIFGTWYFWPTAKCVKDFLQYRTIERTGPFFGFGKILEKLFGPQKWPKRFFQHVNLYKSCWNPTVAHNMPANDEKLHKTSADQLTQQHFYIRTMQTKHTSLRWWSNGLSKLFGRRQISSALRQSPPILSQVRNARSPTQKRCAKQQSYECETNHNVHIEEMRTRQWKELVVNVCWYWADTNKPPKTTKKHISKRHETKLLPQNTKQYEKLPKTTKTHASTTNFPKTVVTKPTRAPRNQAAENL